MWAFVSGFARERSLLILVEDLHWSDEASLELLLYLIRRTAATPLALLLTYRGDERGAALSRFLAEIDRERIATELVLAATRSASGGAAGACHPRSPAAGRDFLCARLARAHRWEPLFVEEVLRALTPGTSTPRTRDGTASCSISCASRAASRTRSSDVVRSEPYDPRGVDPGFGRRAPVRLQPAPL